MTANANLPLERLDYPVPGVATLALRGATAESLRAALDVWNRWTRDSRIQAVLLHLLPLDDDRDGLSTMTSDLPSDDPYGAKADAATWELGRRLSESPWPVLAVLEGACRDRAADLALFAELRVVASDPTGADSSVLQSAASVGWPAVRWGRLPAAAVARLPRLVGIARAVEWLAVGDSIDVPALLAAGWADAAAPRPELLAHAAALALERAAADRSASRPSRPDPDPGEPLDADLLLDAAVARLRGAARGHEPLARRIGRLIVETSSLDAPAAFEQAVAAARAGSGDPLQTALLNVARLVDRNRRDSGVDGAEAPAHAVPIARLAVVGAGLMGTGIAAAALRSGLSVTLVDSNPDALRLAGSRVVDEAALDRRSRSADPRRREELAARLSLADSLDRLAPCDAAVEAVVENVDVKRGLLPELEARLVPGGLLASNTSTIPIARLAERLVRRDRCCGIHFFNPVRIMPLVEVIRGPETSDASVAQAVALAKRIGKTPIVVRDSPGFLVNRLLFAYLNEAIQLLHEGASIAAVDQAARQFGMPIGPIELCDLIGIDTVYYCGRTMYGAFPDRTLASPIPPALMKAGRLGHKVGAGFLTYDDPRGAGRPDSTVAAILENYRKGAGDFDDERLWQRLFLPMLLEATRVLSEGVVRDAGDVDFGVIFGLGFPSHKGGLLYWADTVGASQIVRWVERFAALGPRWRPTPGLLERAASGGTFYSTGGVESREQAPA